jgi:hypothetical protein
MATDDRSAETLPGNPTNPTAAEFAEMIAAYKRLSRAALQLDDSDPAAEAAHDRADTAYEALMGARPIDPDAMACQLRWLLGQQLKGDNPADRAIVEHVADFLEAMTRPATTPASEEFTALLAELDAAIVAHQAAERAGIPGDMERWSNAFAAMRAARPNDPATMARQLCFLIDRSEIDADDAPAIMHIAAFLGAMARPATTAPAGDLADIAQQARALAGRLQEPRNHDLAAAIADRL